ncbi:hypothetical protein J437_LFUL010743 [Ladona fulva]|uniref:RRM domain-containing protein n=1 Tax=Ladona fulva TaxID=123851 RepID=A0A8K0P492_LADFU|nr:hypothetical protein J437_LFUL010743 [Ladona fulva]
MANLNDEQLLEDEDGEDEYDLGNDEEEALLADDGDPDQDLHDDGISYVKKSSGRKSILYSESKGYCETEEPLEEDVLDLDDCESDLENVEYADELEYADAQDELDQESQHEEDLQYHEGKSLSLEVEGDAENNNEVIDTDLGHQDGEAAADAEEHLQPQDLDDEASGQKESEEEEDEEDRQDGEGRDRFKTERTTMISLKGNKSFGNIPDTLDGLITTEEKQEVTNRWKRGGRGGFSRGGFRGNQRGYNANFGQRRKQMQGQNRQSNQNIVFPHQRLEGPSDSPNTLLPSPFLPSSHKIHINPHFRGNVQPQPEGPIWNENVIGNLPSSNSGNQHPPFHDAPRFPPPSMGFGNVDHRDMPMNMMDHHQQRRSPPPNPFHPNDRSAGLPRFWGISSLILSERLSVKAHVPPVPEAWMNPPQRLQESSIRPPGGHHHQYGGGQQHFSSNHMHSERGTGEVLHFRPTIQPGPLFSHVNQVAPPAIPQQNLILHQQQLQNLMRSAPPLPNAGLGQMLQFPPQEPHNRIPPPGFSPNDGRSVQSLHHGPPSPWQEPPNSRSPLGGQQLPMVQQQQQHGGFHQGGPRSFPMERGSNLQGPPLHQMPHSSASMPPPPFNSANMPQGPPPHPMHHQHPPGNRPMRGGGHMTPGRGGMGQRRGATQSVRPVRPMQTQKPPSEEVFPPKRPPVPIEGASPTLKPSPPKKRKLRKIMKSNLHEVETVDTLPDTTTINEKETQGGKEPSASSEVSVNAKPEDAALLEYQKKIEQQKRMREKILQQKEQRRKLTALQKQKELQEKAALSGAATHEEPKGNAIATIVNRNPVEPSPSVNAKKEPVHISPFHIIGQRKGLMALKTMGNQNSPRQPLTRGVAMRGVGPRRIAAQGTRMQNPGAIGSPQAVTGNLIQQGGQTYKIVQVKNEQGQIVRKKVLVRSGLPGRGNPLGRGQVMEVGPQQIRPIGQGRGNIVGNKATQQQQGRKVVVQSLSGGGDNQAVEGKRRGTVVVENLAASTSEADLRKMCQSVGQVLNIQMVPNHRKAIVEFAHPASAVTFFQGYQRKIVDLSMITVRLANS